MIGSLFSGIGGLELGLEWAGLGPVAFQVEIDPFCRRVLAKHWPDATRHEDVKTVGANNLPRVDLICGGFPCQDVSSAGAGAGLKHGTRSGLWYEYLRIVGELRPARVVVENVASGAKRWLCEVRGNLHAIGYRTRAFALSAADVGSPQSRARVFVVASDVYPASIGADAQRNGTGERNSHTEHASRPFTYPDDGRGRRLLLSSGQRNRFTEATHSNWWAINDIPSIHRVDDGISKRLDRSRVKTLGNSVVPQCAEAIGRMIVEGYA